jgi:hypothetical protein
MWADVIGYWSATCLALAGAATRGFDWALKRNKERGLKKGLWRGSQRGL